jgi:hypothetical protein
MDKRVCKDKYVTKADDNKKTFNLANYSSDYIKKADRCIVDKESDGIIYTVESKKRKQKREKKQSIKRKEDKHEDKHEDKQREVYTQQLELSFEDVEVSFDNNSGDLFQIQQIEDNCFEELEAFFHNNSGDLFHVEQLGPINNMEDNCFEELEAFFHNNSGDLFCIQQIEWKEDVDAELSIVLDNPDLFSTEIYQVDFEELNEKELSLAEASMWNETGEVVFE